MDYPYKTYLYNIGFEPKIANGVYINGFIDCSAQVTVEKNVFCGHDVLILTGSHDYFKKGKARIASIITKPVTIKEGAWIASRVTILPGVIIGKNSVVGAGSVVTKDVPNNELWAGNPIKFIKKI